jgi:hypothetical protein
MLNGGVCLHRLMDCNRRFMRYEMKNPPGLCLLHEVCCIPRCLGRLLQYVDA